MCARHRDVTKPHLESYLSRLVGSLTNLRSIQLDTSDEETEEEFNAKMAEWKQLKALNQEAKRVSLESELAKNERDDSKMDTEESGSERAPSSLSEFPGLVEVPPPTEKRRGKKRKTARKSTKGAPVEKKPKEDIELQKQTTVIKEEPLEEILEPNEKSKSPETISISDDDDEKSPEEDSKCCITGCKSKTARQGGKLFVSKVGAEPNVEYVILCENHRNNLTNAEDLGVAHPGILNKLNEPNRKQQAQESFGAHKKPESSILKRFDYLPQDGRRPSTSSNSTTSNPSPQPHISVQEKTTASVEYPKNRIVNEEIVQLMANDGTTKDFIMREYDNSTIVYVPTTSQKTTPITPKVAPPKINPPQPRVIAPVPAAKPKVVQTIPHPQNLGGVSQSTINQSQLVYVQGKPFILTKVEGLGKNQNVTPMQTLEPNQSGELSVRTVVQNQPSRMQNTPVIKKFTITKPRAPEPVIPKILSVQSMASSSSPFGHSFNDDDFNFDLRPTVAQSQAEPVPVALQKAQPSSAFGKPQYSSPAAQTVPVITADVAGALWNRDKPTQQQTATTRVFTINDKQYVLQKGQKLPDFRAHSEAKTKQINRVMPQQLHSSPQRRPQQQSLPQPRNLQKAQAAIRAAPFGGSAGTTLIRPSVMRPTTQPGPVRPMAGSTITLLRASVRPEAPKPVSADPLSRFSNYPSLSVKNLGPAPSPATQSTPIADNFDNIVPSSIQITRVQSMAPQPSAPIRKGQFYNFYLLILSCEDF